MVRTIQAPGIELNEIDRSGYEQKNDNSIVGTTSLLMGFADSGADYTVQYINSMNTFVNTYGNPKNEAEKYFYNGAYEIISRGGRLYTAKLPYDNNSLDMFPFTTYTVGTECYPLSSPYDVMINNRVSAESSSGKLVNLYDFLLTPNVDFSNLVFILVDLGIVPEGTDPEQLLQTEYSQNTYIITEDSQDVAKIDFCSYYTRSGISLSIICDFMDFVIEQTNVNYYIKDAIDYVFRFRDLSGDISSLNGLYRNDSAYLIKNMMLDINAFKRQHLVSCEMSAEYGKQLDMMYDNLREMGTFYDIQEEFGKSSKLPYFRNYFYNLSSQVIINGLSGTGKTDSDYDTKELLKDVLSSYDRREYLYAKYTDIKQFDNNITSYIEISSNSQSSGNSGMISLQTLDKLLIKDQNVPRNQFMIVDTSRTKYTKDSYFGENLMYVGIVPVITTAVNAMIYQNVIQCSQEDVSDYIVISSLQNTFSDLSSNMMCNLNNSVSVVSENKIVGFTQNLGSEPQVTETEETLSKTAVKYFPQINNNMHGLNFEHIKKIGVVVFKMYIDTANQSKIAFLPVESFTGSLNKNSIDNTTNKNLFIDNIINNSSKYIKFFSNMKYRENQTEKELYTDKAETFIIKNQNITSLGLYESDCDKQISIKTSINEGIDKILESMKDPNRYRIDMIVDAGVSNISQFIKQTNSNTEKGYYDVIQDKSYLFKIFPYKDVRGWLNVINKYDNFCKYVRKDCMFIADGLRSLCLNGNEKVVRNTKPENTIENTILKWINYMSGYINSSYGAGYCDWFRCIDSSSGDYFWCPPSIKAAGIYTYTDAYSDFWMAPAGMSRGRLPQDVIDCAFSPTIDQAGKIYNNNWNYAVNYPIDGIVMEGQRTFQKNKTALDRVNVRRLCLGVEKAIKYIAKFFNYEQNTAWLRQRFKDQISNYLESVRNGDGISEYYVICDDRNNTIQTIENNELHITIAVKPIKAVEFIICQFVCTNQSANVVEVAESEM